MSGTTTDKFDHLDSIINTEPRTKSFLKSGSDSFWKLHPHLHETAGEVFGTCIVITFGCGVCAQYVLFGGKDGQFLSANLGWAVGVFFGILTSFHISGAHLNPAVTLAFVLYKSFPIRKALLYVLAQIFGAFLGSFFVWAAYYDALNHITGGHLVTPGGIQNATLLGTINTAGIWATYPAGTFISHGNALLTEIVGTSLLVISIFSITDRADPIGRFQVAGFCALAVLGVQISFGAVSAAALNPARDLGPRFFTFLCGYGNDVFTAYGCYFWVPLLGPLLGGVLGGALHQLL